MTVTQDSAGPREPAGPVVPAVEMVTVTIDGFEVQVPKNTLVIRAAELIGIQIPRFCDHPLLDPVGACRQCIVEVEGQRKPMTSCTTTCTDGMVVKTQLTSAVAEKAQRGMIEMLLINHPLDCPICDKGGECPLQNQSMSNGNADSRFVDVKRTYPKPIAISAQVLLDRERCVLCARCTRFSQQIAGDPFIELFERGALQQVAIYAEDTGAGLTRPFDSYFSGNTVQICPVGALTGSSYRFRSRPFDLVSTPTVCEHCAAGCAMRTDHRRGRVLRRLAGDDPQVNEEWNCDKGRWAFTYATRPDRLTGPLVRDPATGELQPASWTEALRAAAEGLRAAAGTGRAGVLTGGRCTVEDAWAYAKFARVGLGTNNVDFRARPVSAEETDVLAAAVVGSGLRVSYADVEAAPAVVLAGLEPEEETPILFLRLRKAARTRGLRVHALAPLRTRGLTKMSGTLVPVLPGDEAAALSALLDRGSEAGAALREPGAVLMVGERLALAPGALSAAVRVARETGARLAWVPRRAGDRGALEAGAFPTLLPGSRPVSDAAARAELGGAWGADLPSAPGLDTAGIVAAASDGGLDALVVGGVDPVDLPDPALALHALARVPFLVSLEIRESAVTELANVVLPVAPVAEKAGTFLDWEGRERPFAQALPGTGALPDARVLHLLADALGVQLGLPDLEAVRREILELGAPWHGRPAPAVHPAAAPPRPGPGEALLATWHWLLDAGRMQDGEPYLAGTAKRPRLHLSPETARRIGVEGGALVTVTGPRGEVTLPLEILDDMVDDVVWVPTSTTVPGSPAGVAVRRDLAAAAGTLVRVAPAPPGTDAGGVARPSRRPWDALAGPEALPDDPTRATGREA